MTGCIGMFYFWVAEETCIINFMIMLLELGFFKKKLLSVVYWSIFDQRGPSLLGVNDMKIQRPKIFPWLD